MKSLSRLLVAGWVLWAFDLDDFNIVKAQWLMDFETWNRCAYALIVVIRNDTLRPNPALPLARRESAVIFQCLPDTYTPKTGSLK